MTSLTSFADVIMVITICAMILGIIYWWKMVKEND